MTSIKSVRTDDAAWAEDLLQLDPRFADVIVRRWQDFTGGDAIREGDRARFGEMMGVEA